MKVLALILSLSLLVITHEFGHFFFARFFKTRVRRFYLFFNWKFSILKAKKFGGKWHFLFFNATTPEEWDEKNLAPEDQDNTLWGIGWIPLGGYCDIAGMIDETKGKEELEKEPQSWEYWGKDELPLRNAELGYDYHELLLKEGFQNGDIIYAIDGKEMTDIVKTQHALLLDNPKTVTVMRKVAVADTVISGDAANGEPINMSIVVRDTQMLVDIALSYNLIEKIDPSDTNLLFNIRAPFVIKDFAPGSHGKRAGLQSGDSVVAVAGKWMSAYSDISPELANHKSEEVNILFYRDGKLDSAVVAVGDDGKIGVYLMDPLKCFNSIHHEYTFLQAIPVGVSYGFNQLTTYARSLKILFTPDGYKGLGGFGTLGGLFPATWDWFSFWNITAFLAVILAFMNIIPILGLDGLRAANLATVFLRLPRLPAWCCCSDC